MLRVTIWMNMPSFYQDELYRVLAATGDVDLRVVFSRDLPSDRRALGWSSTTGSYPQRVLPPRRPLAVVRAIAIALAERDRIHIVNGIWAEPPFAAALAVLSAAGSRLAIYAEAPTPLADRSRWKRALRGGFGRWVARRPNAALLPIAGFAERYYQGLGFRPGATYPFAYFRRAATDEERADPEPTATTLGVIAVGQLIPRKGLDLLLDALAPLCAEDPRWRLTLVGDGVSRVDLEEQAARLGIADRVTFAGMVPSEEVRRWIASADLLALPSRWDGWGLVVNEAFSVGVPVIVSDRCGVADLVEHGRNGFVFRSEDAADLRASLRAFRDGRAGGALARSARDTGDLITIERAADYLVGGLRHMAGTAASHPVPEWLPGHGGGRVDE